MIWIIFYTIILLFTNRQEATAQCLKALTQWYETMIPALFPMMLLSSILVDTGFAGKLGCFLNQTLLRCIRISDNGCYCLITGFLCGFPMGAKTTSDMLKNRQISPEEANYLLSFINCIGPMYTINLIHKLFPEHALWKLLVGLYVLPIVYGFLYRYIRMFGNHKRNINASSEPSSLKGCQNTLGHSVPELSNITKTTYSSTFSDAFYESVPKCGKSILTLGGYMILFQTFFVTLKELLLSISITTPALYPLVEITGGLFLQPEHTPLSQILLWNTWGGACCMMQTYSFIKPAGLSMKSYLFHKTVLALLAYILGIFLHQI